MKRNHLLAAASLAALGSGAFAQSSAPQDARQQPWTPSATQQTAQPGLPAQVTGARATPAAPSSLKLSGVIDEFVSIGKTGATSYRKLSSGGSSSSLLVLSGSEDLGNGMRANFMLDGGIDADTGAGSAGNGFAFTRQSYVSLQMPWGSISAGKGYTPMFGVLYIADPFGMNSLSSPTNLIYGSGGQPGLAATGATGRNPSNTLVFSARSANTVRFTTATSNPLVVDLGYSLGEVAGQSRTGSIISGGLGYRERGRFFVGYAFQIQKSGGGMYGGQSTPSAIAAVDSPLTSTFQALAGSYNITPNLKLGGSFILTKVNDDISPKSKIWQLGVTWDLPAASSTVLASFARRTVDDTSGFNQNAFNLGYNYHLSKRTSLYTRYVRYSNAGSNFGFYGGRGTSNPISGQPPSSPADNGAARTVMLGIRHAF